LQAPARAGSTFFNNKGTPRIVLIAFVNSDYEFIMVDIGEVGRHSDGGLLQMVKVYAMNNDLLHPPAPRKISPNLGMQHPH